MRAPAVVLMVALAAPAAAADMNISQFVFRDENRNGVYDVGEQPFAGAAVTLLQESRGAVVRESNLSGFTNFPMSADEEDKDITAPGPLTFRIVLPEGMELTTGNPSQGTVARFLDGSPGGIVVDPPLPFMGLAPKLTITSGAAGVERMTCDGTPAERGEDGFVCDTGAGVFEVVWTLASGEERRRSVTVESWPVRVPLPTERVAVPSEGDGIARFDDILTSENIQEVASGHGGVNWHNWVAAHRKFYQGWGYVNGTVSGQFSAYNSSGHPARIWSDGRFDFIGGFFSVAWPRAMRDPVRIQAIRDGEVVAEDAFRASNLLPIWFDAGWADIDEIRISHDLYWQVVVDDMRFGGLD